MDISPPTDIQMAQVKALLTKYNQASHGCEHAVTITALEFYCALVVRATGISVAEFAFGVERAFERLGDRNV